MKKKIKNAFISLFHAFFSFDKQAQGKLVELSLKGKALNTTLLGFPRSYVKAYFRQNILEFEFFLSSDDVEISIQNSLENIVYRKKIATVETLHILVQTHSWSPGIYSISINNIDDVTFKGNFFLEK